MLEHHHGCSFFAAEFVKAHERYVLNACWFSGCCIVLHPHFDHSQRHKWKNRLIIDRAVG